MNDTTDLKAGSAGNKVNTYGLDERPKPSAQVKALDRLVGSWLVAGGAEGTVTYEWMAGGFFLLQRVDLEQFGQPITGLEVIGLLHPSANPSAPMSSPGTTTHSATPSTTSTNSTATDSPSGQGRGTARPTSKAPSPPTTGAWPGSGSIPTAAVLLNHDPAVTCKRWFRVVGGQQPAHLVNDAGAQLRLL
jgi:hypothetical protein